MATYAQITTIVFDSAVNTTGSYTVPGGYYFYGQAAGATASSIQINGVTQNVGTGTVLTPLHLGPGASIANATSITGFLMRNT